MPQQKSWTKTIADTWSKWTPPDRPSPGELKIYDEALRQILKRNPKPKVMVLGSTSEFRDLYAKYKLPCTVVDYSRDNYFALGTLMKRKAYNETLITGDWRTFKPKEKYDLILGDYCVNVLPKKDQAKFIRHMADILSPDGLCMLKTFVRYDSERPDLAEALKFYRTKMKRRPILETLMAPMFKSVYDFKKEETLFTDLWRKFVSLKKTGKIKKSEFDYFTSLNLGNIPLRVYIPFFPDIIRLISANAKLHSVRFGGEWFSLDVPILVIKK